MKVSFYYSDPHEGPADLLASYRDEFHPQGVFEEELVRQLAVATYRLRRIDESDAEPQLVNRARNVAQSMFYQAYNELEARRERRRPAA